MSERDALIALNLLPFTPAEMRRLLDRYACATSALGAIGSGAVGVEDLRIRGRGAAAAAGNGAGGGDGGGACAGFPPRAKRAPVMHPSDVVPLDPGAPRRLGGDGLERLARLEVERALAEGVRVETLADASYPAALRELPDPPPVLYVRGTLGPDDEVRVAVVGSRRASRYGLEVAPLIAGDLARRGLTIVSGLARGIDAGAHRGALDAGGRTIAVLGSGLGKVYPLEHQGLARRIAECGGAVVSEYPFAMPPLPQCFPRRNRIISGMSAGVVVVEAARASGALVTARLALEQGREVYAVPGPVTVATCVGTNGLLRDGAAHLACIAQDVLDELPAHFRVRLGLPAQPADEAGDLRGAAQGLPLGSPLTAPAGFPGQAGAGGSPPGVDPETTGILRHLTDEGSLSVDELVSRCGLPVSRALAALSILEMRGLVETLPGDRVARSKRRVV